jgi:hypothetical protein
MIFIFNDKVYSGETAVGIVRAIERDTPDYAPRGARVQDFLVWSLARLADAIPPRELEISPQLGDETIAFNYLCLLDNYGLGTLRVTQAAAPPMKESG